MQEIILSIMERTAEEIAEERLIMTMMCMMLIAGICSVVFNKIKLPAIIGYLLAGILIVNVFNLNTSEHWDRDAVEVMKNLGLVMLMFGIGTELSVDKIKRNGRFAALVAIIQLPLMVLNGYVFGMVLFGLEPVPAVALGAIISGSSTAVVAAVLKTQERVSKEAYDTLILVTIMEDIGQVIILSMVTPLFAASSGGVDPFSIIKLIIMIIIFMVASVIIGLKVVPRVLDWIGDNTSSEVLLVFSIGLCFLMAYLAVAVQMSMAIGAFLMGVMVSQSKFGEDIGHKTEPMKEIFMAVFFISVGMKVTFDGFISCLPMALGICALFMISKFVTVFLGYFVGGKNFEESFVSSVSLMAMGEFAFIIGEQALAKGAVTVDFYTSVIGAALLSMIILPIITKFMYRVVDKVDNDCPKGLAVIGKHAYGARSDIQNKLHASPTMEDFMKKNLKKTYFCILIIIVIEIVFASMSTAMQDVLVRIINEFATIDNIRQYVWIGLMVINLLLLVLPTYYLIKSIKSIDKMLMEGEAKITEKRSAEDAEKTKAIYRKVLDFSTVVLILVIDFIIMAVVPGPFGFSDKSTLIAIPIAVGIFFVGILLSKRKAKKDEKQKEEGTA